MSKIVKFKGDYLKIIDMIENIKINKEKKYNRQEFIEYLNTKIFTNLNFYIQIILKLKKLKIIKEKTHSMKIFLKIKS